MQNRGGLTKNRHVRLSEACSVFIPAVILALVFLTVL